MIIRSIIFSSLVGSLSLFSLANASSIDENSGLPKGQKKVTIAQSGEEYKEPTHKDVRVQRVLEDKSTVRTKSVVEKELEIAEKQEKVAREEYNAFSTKMFKESREQKAKDTSTKLQASSKIKMAEWHEKNAALLTLQVEKALIIAKQEEENFVNALIALRNVNIINPTTEEIYAWVSANKDNSFKKKQADWKKKHKALKELETDFQEKKAAWEKKKEELEKLMEEKRKSFFFSKFIDILNKVWGLIKF